VESAVCAHCGAPFLLGDDPPSPALDRPVVLDRRGRGRQGTPAATPLAEDPTVDLVGNAVVDLGPEAELPAGITGAADVSTEVPPARLSPGADPDPDRALRWRRAAARGVDLGVVLLFAAIPLAIAGGLDAAPAADGVLVPHAAAFAAILAFVYETLAHGLAGATAGKHLLRLQVVSPEGGSPGLARSAARAAVSVVGAAALGLPALAALFTRRCRTLHDVVAGTSVVRAP
jgi:uncharacterized RDD family membrane protein YckC